MQTVDEWDFQSNRMVTKSNNIGQNGDRNIILWSDHHAEKEAEVINSAGSIALNYIGGIMT
ncbi:hypothetical protein EDB19DRAFT_1753731, partial [Suillus lakei]